MRPLQTIVLTTVSLLAFAGNSLLCRIALRDTSIDAASFTAIRLGSGALLLAAIVLLRTPRMQPGAGGNWLSAGALFAYAAGFSFAYAGLSTATGALLLFGSVQTTMIGYGLWRGERLRPIQAIGLAIGIGGLVLLLLPGLAMPSPGHAALMIAAGVAWGVYSLRAKGAGNPTLATAGNFLRGAVLAVALWLPGLLFWQTVRLDVHGVLYALVSGVLMSALGYIVWYTVLPHIKATTAATAQLSVPVIAALGGVVLLGEPLLLRSALAGLAVVGGMAMVIAARKPVAPVVEELSGR